MRLYAARKDWPLDRAEARVRREPPAGKIDVLTLELVLGGSLDAGQRARLVEIAGRCPVHRTLQEGVRIVHA